MSRVPFLYRGDYHTIEKINLNKFLLTDLNRDYSYDIYMQPELDYEYRIKSYNFYRVNNGQLEFILTGDILGKDFTIIYNYNTDEYYFYRPTYHT